MANNDTFASKLKSLLNDSFWSLFGLLCMNATAQFFMYPFLARVLGSEQYGVALYQLSYINIFSIAAGVAVNYARMSESARRETSNGDFHWPLLCLCVLFFPLLILLSAFGFLELKGGAFFAYYLLMCATAWRYYADVEFRLRLRYKDYFIYYLCISMGYLAGIPVFYATHCWPFTLLLGELAGILYIFIRGQILPRSFWSCSDNLSVNVRVILTLTATNLFSSAVSSGDRLVLEPLLGGTAVTLYYLASLLGKTISLITTPFNSVIMGHLARYKGRLTYRFMGMVTALSLAVTIAVTFVCTLASHILINILYPREYAAAAPYFLAANLAQILHFVASSVAVILLRFAKNRYQLDINILYALSFFALSVPGAYFGGLRGFTLAVLAASAIRFVHCLALGFYHVARYETKTTCPF